MKREWIHLENPFEIGTRNSLEKADAINEFHMKTLIEGSGDPFINSLKLSYQTPYDNFKNELIKRNDAIAVQTGKTLSLEQLFKQLSSTKIQKWDNEIQIVYPRGSSQYQELLPHKRNSFQEGKQVSRRNELERLSLRLTGIVALAATKTDVDNFITSIETANTVQKGSKSATGVDIATLEPLRKAMAVAMFSNLGAMIAKYPDNTDIIKNYFDLKTIRVGEQTDFSGSVKPLKAHFIVKRKFALTDTISINNKSPFALEFYVVSKKTDVMPSKFYTAPALTTSIVQVSQIGEVKTPNLFVYNPNNTTKGEWEINIL